MTKGGREAQELNQTTCTEQYARHWAHSKKSCPIIKRPTFFLAGRKVISMQRAKYYGRINTGDHKQTGRQYLP